jgi:ADP-ribosylglycohydrolase
MPDFESRVAGAVIGAAIGDALGHPTEFLDAPGIERRFGPAGVTGFELWWERDGRRFAPYTDDTQLAVVVLRALTSSCKEGAWEQMMPRMAAGIARWVEQPKGGHRAPGNACLAGGRQLIAGRPWREAGAAEAGGCGSVMRAYPFGLFFGDDFVHTRELAAEHSLMTHGHAIALAACAAMAVAVGAEAYPSERDRDRWIVEAAAYYDAGTSAMIGDARDAGRERIAPEEVLERLQGWAAHEAIAAAIYCIEYHRGDFVKSVLLGANAPGDSDSVATLAGAILGARHGLEGIPPDWVRDVEDSAELLVFARDAADAIKHPGWRR